MQLDKIYFTLLPFIFFNSVFAQFAFPEVVIEIPYETARYYIHEGFAFMGPSAIDIDENGDIYVAGASQILVYNQNGKYLRTIAFVVGKIPGRIVDIALSKKGELFILTNFMKLYVVDKKVTELDNDTFLAMYSLLTGGLRRLWITGDNRCLLGQSEESYYILEESNMQLNEKVTEREGFPIYECRFKGVTMRKGMPLKWENTTIGFGDRRSVIDLNARKVGAVHQYDDPAYMRLIDVLPQTKKQKFNLISVREVIALSNAPNLFVVAVASIKEGYPGKAKGMSSQIIIVMDKAGNFVDVIESIPFDIVKTGLVNGKNFAVGNDHRPYYLYTQGDKNNPESCVTRIIRW